MYDFSKMFIIFLLVQEQLAPLAMNPEFDYDIGMWIGYGVLLFIACVAIRFLCIFLHFPALRRLGYGMTWQEAVVISWSGLRGAIGLALALLVNLDDALDEAFRYQVSTVNAISQQFTASNFD